MKPSAFFTFLLAIFLCTAQGAEVLYQSDQVIHESIFEAIIKHQSQAAHFETGIPTKKFNHLKKFGHYTQEKTEVFEFAEDEKSEGYVGVGASTVTENSCSKSHVVFIAMRSSNLEKLKESLKKKVRSKSKGRVCARRLRARRLRGAGTEVIFESNDVVGTSISKAVFESNVKIGIFETGISESKFEHMNKLWMYGTQTEYHFRFDSESETYFGIGAAGVPSNSCDKQQIVFVAMRSSNLEKMKKSLKKKVERKMKPPKVCN